MPDEPKFTLTPAQATKRFGKLRGPLEVYQHFSGEGGTWRPDMEQGPEGLVLRQYRFHRDLGVRTQPKWRPRKR